MSIAPILVAALCALAAATPAAAHIVVYEATLSGPAEAPPNASAGTGTARVTLDLDLATMRVEASFAGLSGNVTASHIHCCTTLPDAGTAGVATQTPTFVGFPLGVKAGSYDMTFDLTLASTYNATFITANGGTVGSAMNTLLLGIEAGKAYLNIHSELYRGGEIRGFLAPVPEPGSVALMLAGLAGLGVVARRRTPA